MCMLEKICINNIGVQHSLGRNETTTMFFLKRRFNVDIMMLYILALDHARKLKFCSYIHLPSINKMFQYRYASVRCRRGYYFCAWVLYFSFGTC